MFFYSFRAFASNKQLTTTNYILTPFKHNVDLRLIQSPGIDQGIHTFVGCLDLQCSLFLFPVGCQIGVDCVHSFQIAVFYPDPSALFTIALSQQDHKTGFFAGL